MYTLPVLSGPRQTHGKGEIHENHSVLLCVGVSEIHLLCFFFTNELVVLKRGALNSVALDFKCFFPSKALQ